MEVFVTVDVPDGQSDSAGSPAAHFVPSWLKIPGIEAPQGPSGSRKPEDRDAVTTGHLLGPGLLNAASLNPLGSRDFTILIVGGGLD